MGAGIVILLFAVLVICASMGRLPYTFSIESMSPLIIGGGLTIIGVFLMDFFGWGKVTNEND